MQFNILILLTLTCFGQLFAASANTDADEAVDVRPAAGGAGAAGTPVLVAATTPLSPYLKRVKSLSYEIKTAEDAARAMVLTTDLRSLLESADEASASHPIYQQAAYALFLNGVSLAEGTSVALRKAYVSTTPVRLNEDMYYINFLTEAFVVLERLTDKSKPAWNSYAVDQHEYAPRDSVEWGKYLPSKHGLLFFRQRIDKFSARRDYDMWIAYISNTLPTDIAAKRESAAAIDPSDINMVMTVQMKEGLDIYSPMGISRTNEAAKKLYDDEIRGITRQKLTPSESIWFHALTAHVVQSIHPSVTSFWTFPVPAMAAILANALYPHPQHHIVAPTETQRILAEELGRPLIKSGEVLLEDFLREVHPKIKITRPDTPWTNEFEFKSSSTTDKQSVPIEISIKDLLRTLF